MQNVRVVPLTIAATIAGFSIGNVIAQSVPHLKFDKADLFSATSRLHTESKTDFVFANGSRISRSFEVPVGTRTQTIEAVGHAYQMSAVTVSSVIVFEAGPSEKPTAAERLDEMNAWLLARYPASDARRRLGESDAFREFRDAARDDARALAGQLGPQVTRTFAELTPQQQEAALGLARAAKWDGAAFNMAALLDQWGQHRHPRWQRQSPASANGVGEGGTQR